MLPRGLGWVGVIHKRNERLNSLTKTDIWNRDKYLSLIDWPVNVVIEYSIKHIIIRVSIRKKKKRSPKYWNKTFRILQIALQMHYTYIIKRKFNSIKVTWRERNSHMNFIENGHKKITSVYFPLTKKKMARQECTFFILFSYNNNITGLK